MRGTGDVNIGSEGSSSLNRLYFIACLPIVSLSLCSIWIYLSYCVSYVWCEYVTNRCIFFLYLIGWFEFDLAIYLYKSLLIRFHLLALIILRYLNFILSYISPDLLPIDFLPFLFSMYFT